MPETARYLAENVITELAAQIKEHGGAELFAILRKGEGDDFYNEVQVVCRGTHSEVPALLSRCRPGDMTVHNHPSGVLHPSQADMQVAALFGEEGIGSMIVNNSVSHCIVIVEPSVEAVPVAVPAQDVASVFAPDGPLAAKLTRYEEREGQVAMAHRVAATINEGEILAVEAGTGTGKSLAYLVPTLLWTKHNKGRVVIATKTIALQEQLVYKDIPLARSVIPDAPQASLVKGRNNYICLRKLQDLKSNQLDLFEEEGLKGEIRSLEAWVEETGNGDKADLPFMPSNEAWEMVRSDADMCLGPKCPFYQKAPFYESRRAAAKSKLLVVNQALLFSDLALRSASGNYQASAVIPPYQHIILDEAHSVEDIATDHFGTKVSSFGLRLTLGKFLSSSRSNRGILHRLFQAAVEKKLPGLVKALEEKLIPEFRTLQELVTEQVYALSAALHEMFNPDQYRQVVVWLKEEVLQSERMDGARGEAKSLLGLLHELLLVLQKVRENLKEQPESFLEKMSGLLIELDARLSRLENTMSALKSFAIRKDENQIPWLELRKSRQHDEFEYRVSPLDVAPLLREALFKPFKSVVMTSATLDLDDGFAFLAGRNGLAEMQDRDWQFVHFPSPFDYSAQVRLFLVDMPSNPNQRSFIGDLGRLILDTATADLPGGTLVLFTSYQLLYAVVREVEIPLGQLGIPLMVQGREQRGFLLQRLKETQGVLFGTDSFWEGVDLPGEALTKVIITKLPFRQMGDPIFEARCTAIDSEGRSSFKEYSLPLALLKFKQGAGRLIRTRDDRGVLIVADNRVRAKFYGRRFLKLVENYPLIQLSQGQIQEQLTGTRETV